MRFICSAQRQVELRRLGNQLPVLCKANSLCAVGNISLQLEKRDINDSETVYFVIQYHNLIVSYIFFVKFCLWFYNERPLVVRKTLNSIANLGVTLPVELVQGRENGEGLERSHPRKMWLNNIKDWHSSC